MIVPNRIKNGNYKSMTKIDIADLDVIFLTYDEPEKEQFWVKIHNMIPWARRVDGVKGSDSAHKAAANASTTERFILIDGDNLPDPEFFNQILELPDPHWEQAVFRWRARNHINGLMYGNGGISSWTKSYVMAMKTHENSTGSHETQVEFCFDSLYWPMHDCFSTTYPNGSPFQAWRSGFREGVKMSLDRGQKPKLSEFKSKIHFRNLDHLAIWHNVGTDVDNGLWAIAGARMGTYMTLLSDWDFRQVQSFDRLSDLWSTVKDNTVTELVQKYQQELETQLELPMNLLNPKQSRFFKYHYRSNWANKGVMVREQDVYR